MCYTRRKIEGDVVALRESDDTNFLKPNGQSRNLNIYGFILNNRENSIEESFLAYCPDLPNWSQATMQSLL